MFKNNPRFSLVVFAALIITSCTNAPKSNDATVTEPQAVANNESANAVPLDLAGSQITWIGTKVTGRHNGIIEFSSGNFMMKDGDIIGGDLFINMETLRAVDMDEKGNSNLTGHLKSEDFFDVGNHPSAKFEITKVAVYDENIHATTEEVDPEFSITNPTHMISGNLEIKGISKNITFPADIKVGNGRMKAAAKFNINRMDWDVKYAGKPDDLISEIVHLGFTVGTVTPGS